MILTFVILFNFTVRHIDYHMCTLISGIKLRKVEKRCDENTGRYDTLRGAPALHDVASILARRVAVELSDSSSDESDSDDSDQWTESRA